MPVLALAFVESDVDKFSAIVCVDWFIFVAASLNALVCAN